MTTAPPRPPYAYRTQHPHTVWDVPAGPALPPAPPARTGGPTAALITMAVMGAVVLAAFGVWGVLAVAGAAGSTTGGRSVEATSAPSTSGWGAAARDVVGQRGQTLTVGNLQLTPQKLRKVEYLTVVPTKCSAITYTNVGSGPMWIGPIDWTLRDPSGATLSATYADPMTGLPSGYLGSGESITGDVCFATGALLTGWDLVFSPGHYSGGPSATFHG